MKNWLDLHEPAIVIIHIFIKISLKLFGCTMYRVVKNYYDGQVNKKCAHAKE